MSVVLGLGWGLRWVIEDFRSGRGRSGWKLVGPKMLMGSRPAGLSLQSQCDAQAKGLRNKVSSARGHGLKARAIDSFFLDKLF